MRKHIPFTKQGLEDLKKEYADLQTQRVDAVKELTTARDMGDRSENAAYKSARWKLSGIDRRLRQIKKTLDAAQVVEREFTGKADIGTVVTITDNVDSFTYTLVGGYESDLSKGRLSVYSPIGKALMGKKTGEAIIVEVPAGTVAYRVTSVTASKG